MTFFPCGKPLTFMTSIVLDAKAVTYHMFWSSRNGQLEVQCNKIRLPDDCTIGFIVCKYIGFCTHYTAVRVINRKKTFYDRMIF